MSLQWSAELQLLALAAVRTQSWQKGCEAVA